MEHVYVMANTSDFDVRVRISEGQIVSLHPGVSICTSEILLGVTLRWTSILSKGGGVGGGVAILLITSCYRNRVKLRPWGGGGGGSVAAT